jgi:effector-binding domain-containing protein
MSGVTETPRIETRAEQPYVAVVAQVAMAELAELAQRFGEVFGWLDAHGLQPGGAPFFKYDEIDMAGTLRVQAGVPIASLVQGDAGVVGGVLPGGRYVTVLHHGHPDQLEQATASLLEWADEQGLRWDMTPGERGEVWGSRLEFYLTDPNEEPDLEKWVTQLAFRLAP